MLAIPLSNVQLKLPHPHARSQIRASQLELTGKAADRASSQASMGVPSHVTLLASSVSVCHTQPPQNRHEEEIGKRGEGGRGGGGRREEGGGMREKRSGARVVRGF